jgi:hypothetical protein
LLFPVPTATAAPLPGSTLAFPAAAVTSPWRPTHTRERPHTVPLPAGAQRTTALVLGLAAAAVAVDLAAGGAAVAVVPLRASSVVAEWRVAEQGESVAIVPQARTPRLASIRDHSIVVDTSIAAPAADTAAAAAPVLGDVDALLDRAIVMDGMEYVADGCAFRELTCRDAGRRRSCVGRTAGCWNGWSCGR